MSETSLPLPENWEALDSERSYLDAIRAIGERVKAGAPVPPLFVPRAMRDRDELADQGSATP